MFSTSQPEIYVLVVLATSVRHMCIQDLHIEPFLKTRKLRPNILAVTNVDFQPRVVLVAADIKHILFFKSSKHHACLSCSVCADQCSIRSLPLSHSLLSISLPISLSIHHLFMYLIIAIHGHVTLNGISQTMIPFVFKALVSNQLSQHICYFLVRTQQS